MLCQTVIEVQSKLSRLLRTRKVSIGVIMLLSKFLMTQKDVFVKVIME